MIVPTPARWKNGTALIGLNRTKTSLSRVRNGAIVLIAVFVVAVLGFRFWGDYDWIGAIWMVVITISTVGYGEQSSASPAMQLFTVSVILVGMSASVYTMGGLLQLMLEGELERAIGRRRMEQELRKLEDHIIVCGFGRMGQKLAAELREQEGQLVVLESDPATQQTINELGLMSVCGDATEEEALLAAGVQRARTLVTALPSDADNVFITLTARNLNGGLQIISRAERQSTEKKLRQAGANRVVMPTLVGARQMARMITHPTTADLMELVAQSGYKDFELGEIEIGSLSPLVGRTVEETEATRKHGLL
ncbi:MAG: NAD-binding protein, partial [Pirellulales bacterium]|nr:NAD-binding protein [Pirellulales bacterium]